jgi:ribosome biogenesis GTPase / thiamine phosphate phosphatase
VPSFDGSAPAGLGWGPDFQQAFEPHAAAGLVPGRVAVQHRGSYGVYTAPDPGPVASELSGRFRHESVSALDLPAVGDWVALRTEPGAERALVEAVLPRRTVFVRKAASDQHRGAEEQVVAANVDVVFVVSGLVDDLSPRRLERYLVLAWESGARPAIVLTKADLCLDLEASLAEVEPIALGVPVHVVSNVTGEGIEQLRPYFEEESTVAALGSSGVGKSSLINRLAGNELQEVKEVRSDGRGRHTTTRRELIRVPGGGLFLDTPGMRELQLWEADAGIEEAFEDVAALVARCRFSDCAHVTEPGCAVLAAIDAGSLDPARLESYRKLERELERLERRLDARAQSEARKERRRFARSRRKVSW